MTIGVVIATHGRPDSLPRTLDALADCRAVGGHPHEVVVVENGTRFARPIVEGRGHRYVFEPEANASKARNIGARMLSDATIYLFTDDDTEPPPEWLKRMTEPILSGRAAATTGGARLVSDGDLSPEIRAILVDTSKTLTQSSPWLICGNMAIEATCFNTLEGFEEELGPGALGGHEDVLLGMRLTSTGQRIEVVHGVEVAHHFQPARLTREGLLSRSRAQGRSEGWVMHHWLRSDLKWLRLRICRSMLMASLARLRRHGPLGAESERAAVQRLWRERQLLVERRRPPKYASPEAAR